MRPFLILFLLLLLSTVKSQTLDSTHYKNKSTTGGFYRSDTGTYLPKTVFVDEQGNQKTLADYKGKIVYLNIWATWCGNCIIRFPHEEQLLTRLKKMQLDTAVVMINVNIDDTKTIWKKALKKYYPVGINLYSSDTSLYDKWNISAIPAYNLFDRSGKVLGLKIFMPDESGPIDWVLYNAAKGVSVTEALRLRQEQVRLMEQYHTPAAFTNKGYADWFSATLPLFLEYEKWRQDRKTSKPQ